MDFAGQAVEKLAARYLRHVAFGGLKGKELDEAELTYVLWDWDELALLAYRQYLEEGRGVFIGPRAVIDKESLCIAFDYVSSSGAIRKLVGRTMANSLLPNIAHYHPELDLVVVWQRSDGSARFEVLRSTEKKWLRSPRDLYFDGLGKDVAQIN
jgi:hypothetical protein